MISGGPWTAVVVSQLAGIDINWQTTKHLVITSMSQSILENSGVRLHVICVAEYFCRPVITLLHSLHDWFLML